MTSPPSAPVEGAQTDHRPGLHPTVHVVDDDPAILRSLRWLIESMGLAVELYPSAAAFLERYDPQTPGCVVLDVRMPGMSGLDLQKRLVQLGYVIPVIIVTGYGDVPMAVRAMQAGAVDFIEKPVSDRVLLQRIERALARDRQAREQLAIAAPIRRRMETLTRREREVMQFILAGMTSGEIAEELQICRKTVESHRANIMKKMQARGLPHLVRMNLQARLAKDWPPT